MPLDFLKATSLQARASLLVLFMFVLSLGGLGLYANQLLRQSTEQLTSDQQLATATILAEQVAHELDIRFQALESVAQSITPSHMADANSLQELLAQRQVLQNLYSGGTFVSGLDGTAKAGFPQSFGRQGINYADRDYISAALQSGIPFLGKPVIDRVLKVPVVPMAVPIRDNTGKVTGVLAGIVNLGMPSFLTAFSNNGYGKQGGYFIVSTQHRLIVTATDPSRIMEQLPPSGTSATIDKLMAGFEGSIILTNPHGVQVLNSGKRIKGTDWDMVVSLPTSEAFAPIHSMQHNLVLGGVLLAMVAGGMTWLMLRRQLKPAFEAIDLLHRLARGDPHGAALPVTRQDELGKLIASFNTLLETMRLQAMALRVSDQALQDISQAVVITDHQQNVISSNEAHVTITGYSKEEMMGQNCRILQGPLTDPLTLQALRQAMKDKQPFGAEILNYRKDGTPFWNDLSITPMRDGAGQITHYVGVTRDVTERKAAEGNVRQLAFFDTLTNLPNRRLLKDRLGQALVASKRSSFYGAVMFMDLDNFKRLNDTHGHATGDVLLVEVANRLKHCVREVDTLARFGGDEFVVILSELDSDKAESTRQAASIAEKIRAALSHTYQLTIHHPGLADTVVAHQCTASIGVVLFMGQDASEDDLLKWADSAMYQAKAAGNDAVRFFHPNA